MCGNGELAKSPKWQNDHLNSFTQHCLTGPEKEDPSSPAAPEKTVRDSNNAGEGPARAGGGDQVELGHGDGEFESPLSREFALI
ncbi:hypothetical protein DM860_012432 [Cuscuta australis]|uniref:Uncharacterized protein n=1 Tax=Cuscuta australis TaxID=267555 RepID=A0A328DGH2_9ASTE|nr:hypothetical protein DM860_012432 [Cuscuta australis]